MQYFKYDIFYSKLHHIAVFQRSAGIDGTPSGSNMMENTRISIYLRCSPDIWWWLQCLKDNAWWAPMHGPK